MKIGKQKQTEVIEEIAKPIEEVAEKVISNKERVEKQRMDLLVRISELEKELQEQTNIPGATVNSFSIEDIEAATTPKFTKDEIRRMIMALRNASELPVYSDNSYMDSIYEYLEVIRPELQRIDEEQWRLIELKKNIQKEYKESMNIMWKEYRQLERKVMEILKVVDINYPTAYGFNKHVKPGMSWTNKINNLVDIVDNQLKEKNGQKYVTKRNCY